MTGLFLDLQNALRGPVRNRAVASLAAGCLGLGVGTCAAMLGLLDVLLLRPPEHVKDAGRLRRVYFAAVSAMGERTSSVTSYPVFQDLEKVRSFEALGAYVPVDVSVGRGEEARRARARRRFRRASGKRSAGTGRAPDLQRPRWSTMAR